MAGFDGSETASPNADLVPTQRRCPSKPAGCHFGCLKRLWKVCLWPTKSEASEGNSLSPICSNPTNAFSRTGLGRLAKSIVGSEPQDAASIIWPGQPSFMKRLSNWSWTSFHSAESMILRAQIIKRLLAQAIETRTGMTVASLRNAKLYLRTHQTRSARAKQAAQDPPSHQNVVWSAAPNLQSAGRVCSSSLDCRELHQDGGHLGWPLPLPCNPRARSAGLAVLAIRLRDAGH